MNVHFGYFSAVGVPLHFSAEHFFIFYKFMSLLQEVWHPMWHQQHNHDRDRKDFFIRDIHHLSRMIDIPFKDESIT